MMENNSDSSSKECDWLVEDFPNVKPPLENGSENQQRQKQMLKDTMYSTNTCTTARKDETTTTTSTDDSSKRRKLPSVAKSDLYKTKMCRNYMETGKVQVWESMSICSRKEGVEEVLVVCLFE